MKLSQKEEKLPKLAKLIRKLQIKGITEDIFRKNYISNGHKIMSFDVHNDSLHVTKYHAILMMILMISTSIFLRIKLFMC